MDAMSQKIKYLRQKHKLTLQEVADKVGVGSSTVRKWEVGYIKNMKRDKIAALAKALHTTPAYLMGWEDMALSNKNETTAQSINKKEIQKTIDNIYKELDILKNKLELNEDAAYNIKNYFTVKCFGQVSAGTGVVLDDEYAEDIDIDFNPPKHDYVLKINGDSMEPAFADGQIIFVKQQSSINNGEFGIFILDGQGYFKKYSIDYEKKKAVLISLNDKYDDIDLSEYEDVRCVGKVIV